MHRPRILIFSLADWPFVGGAEVAVREIIDRLAGKFEFEVINADIKSFWSKYLYPFWAYRRAVRQHRVRNYDLVWAVMANQAGMAAALFKLHFPSVPFLLTLQEGDDLKSLPYRLRLLAPRLFNVFRRADEITAISQHLARWARQMGAPCPISVIPNGVDLDKFKSQSSKAKSGSQKSKVIITTSRLVRKNGVDILIEAMRFLPNNMQLRILGTGPEEISLKQLVSRRCLDRRVEFLGQVSPNEVFGYLARADVFVRPARSEGLGNSFLEAMAAGVPVVGTPVGGIPDFLTEAETGWFCEVDNPKSIAEKVNFILDESNQALVQKVVIQAKNLISRNYNWSLIDQKMAQIIANLVRKS